MKVGKLPNSLLKEIIIDKLRKERKEVLVRPGIGEDCGVVDFDKNVCVISSDPITGAVNEVGRLAVHVSCNDIASCGAEPVGLVLTVLVPPKAEKEDLKIVMDQVNETAASLNVDIIGGHTEVTDAVNRFVIVSTVLGKVLRDKLVTTKGAKPGDDIVITKSAGLEGTAIIAHDKENELADKIGYDTV
ncbi:MAG: AIR synthase, partial [Clostridiaceae bacterium]|nr:AIR synthase [Clostridiaceae bacterium]